MNLFASYFFVAIGAIFLGWGIGYILRLIVWPKGSASYFRLYFEVVLGLVTGATLFALFATHGVTVLWPACVALLGIGWLQRRKNNEIENAAEQYQGKPITISTIILTLSGVIFGVFGLRYLLLYDPNSSFLLTPNDDFIFYARIATNLSAGIETPALENAYPQFITEQPYHYLELWLTSLLTTISGLQSVFILYLVTYSILLATLYVGFRALLEAVGFRGGVVAVMLPGLFLLLTGVYWPFFNHIPQLYNTAPALSSILPIGPKLLPVFIVLILAALLLIRRQFLATGMAIAVLPLVFVTSTPAVLAACAMMALLLLVTQHRNWYNALGVSVPILISVAFIAAFYIAQPAVVKSESEMGTVLQSLPKMSEAHTIFNLLVGNGLAVLVYFAPFLVLAGAVWWIVRRHSSLHLPQWALLGIVAWVVIVATGLIIWTVGRKYVDSFQFFSNIATPITVVGIAVLLATGMVRLGRIGQWTVILVVVVLLSVNLITMNTRVYPLHITKRYSPAFLEVVSKVLPKVSAAGGGFLLADSVYKNSFSLLFITGDYVFDFANQTPLISLSSVAFNNVGTDSRFRADTLGAKSRIHNSTIYRYRTLEGSNLPKDSVALYLSRKVALRYICAGPGAKLPTFWHSRLQHEYYDPLSRETLYILKPW